MGVWYQAHWYPREKRPAGENFLAQFVEDPVDDDLVYYNYFFTSVFLTYSITTVCNCTVCKC